MPPKNIYRRPQVVACKHCTHAKNNECQLRVCPYVTERITAKVINYEKLIMEFFKGNLPRLFTMRLRKHCRTITLFENRIFLWIRDGIDCWTNLMAKNSHQIQKPWYCPDPGGFAWRR